jgi:biotin carboxylase
VARRPRSEPARLLVLGAGAAQLGLLEAAAARGLAVIVADRDPSAPGFAHATERAIISSEDEPGIERLARARAVDGIVSPGADWPVGIASRVAERLGLPHPIDGATAVLATTKTRQRERLAAAGVPQPRVFSPGDAATPFPCVVKAADRQGQRGLTLVHDAAGLDAAVAVAAAESRGGGILVEELIHGPELTVNAVSVDGDFVPLAVTDRLLAEPPAFGVALTHAWPSEHPTAAVVGAAAAAVAALGIENGPSYTQIRLGPDGRPSVMEVAARLGGGHDAELVRAVTGIDLNDLAISFALGEPVELGRQPRSGSESQAVGAPRGIGGGCVLFLVAPPGELRSTQGLAEAGSIEGVEWVRPYRRPGWHFVPLRRGADRAGAVLAVGESREKALVCARRASETVRFLVDVDAT